MTRKKILFISGTRAEYGKLKSLMKALEEDASFSVYIYICGMHLYEKYGSTYREIEKDGYEHIHIAKEIPMGQNMSLNLANTIRDLTLYVEEIDPDLIVVHGDRSEALAGAVVGAFGNRLVGHIEGGELSGTIDESIRHAVSKLSHVHFVSNKEAALRLIQLGEDESHIFIIGSPDIDIMLSDTLPSLETAKQRYDIPYEKYGILMYHPVTTEYEIINEHIKAVVEAVVESKKDYVVVYPNNDPGSDEILKGMEVLNDNDHFRIFPSLRFEYFLTLLKSAEFIIGNSSAGIRESGFYGIPAIDIGTRQYGRWSPKTNLNLQHVEEKKEDILEAVSKTDEYRKLVRAFGKGDSAERFSEIVHREDFWEIEIQKRFIDF